MTKIDIISGFLGAGKTTLIKKLLSEALKGEQVVLIENEFGEIGIDGGFLKDSGIEIREMNSGCICCSLVGDFGTSLKEVITTYHPDRIIIEPSGVGKLSDVIKAVKGVDVDCEISLNSYTTVADVNKCKMYMRNFGEFFENQLQYARTIILSRTDTPKATEEKVAKAVALIREVNKDAVIITTPIEKLDGAQILEAMEQGREEDEEFCPVCGGHHDHDHEHEHHHHDHDGECGCDHDHEHEHHHHDHDGECGCDHDHEHEHHHHDHDDECGCGHDHDHEHHHHDGECGCGHDHHHHHADEVFTSWGRETAKKYTKEEIEAALKILSEAEDLGVILRAKGMVDGKDGQSFIIAIATTVISMIFCIPAAYSLARFQYPGRKVFMLSFLLTNAFPKLGIYTSIAVLFYKYGLMGTYAGVIIIHMINSMMFMVWLPSSAFRNVHRQQEEAARDAGASPVRTFFKVTLPMAMPGIAVATLYTFLGSMEEAQGTMLVGLARIQTMPVAMYGIVLDSSAIQIGAVFAILLIIPSALLIFVMRKYIGPEAIAGGFKMK